MASTVSWWRSNQLSHTPVADGYVTSVNGGDHLQSGLPVIDVSAPGSTDAVDVACRRVGFFGIVGHGVDPALRDSLLDAARVFFALDDERKAEIEMARAGRAWRGWFPVGGELTSGAPDPKEGIYFGAEHSSDHPRVVARERLHGRNLFPTEPADLGPLVLTWLDEMRRVADAVMATIAGALGLQRDWFVRHLTGDPTVLFRIFHYPGLSPADERWSVGEHTDYGLLTLLQQDGNDGLEVRRTDGTWIAVDPDPDVIICNLGDMLERLTGGRYRSTPHRVRNVGAVGRISLPYFFDPSWDAIVPTIPLPEESAELSTNRRWDDADPVAWTGTYGDYLSSKVARVFPDLF